MEPVWRDLPSLLPEWFPVCDRIITLGLGGPWDRKLGWVNPMKGEETGPERVMTWQGHHGGDRASLLG